MVDVTKDNVDRELPEIMDAIDKADIVALDCVSCIYKSYFSKTQEIPDLLYLPGVEWPR